MNQEPVGGEASAEDWDHRISMSSRLEGVYWRLASVARNTCRQYWFELNSGKWQDALVLTAVVVLSVMAAFSTLPAGTLSDEGFHWHQLLEYFAGRFETVGSLTMFPGYHRTIFGLSEVFSLNEIAEVRYVCFLLAIPALLFFFLVVRQYDQSSSCPIGLQLLLSPIIFPFFFLLYTDIPSLAMVVASVWLVTRRSFQLAALVMGVSLLFRQTNIVWLAMLWAISLENIGFFTAALKNLPQLLREWPYYWRKTWLFSVFCILFGVFLFANNGVAIGDAGNHQLGLYPTQIFLLLFVLFFLFIPLHVVNSRKILALFKRGPLLPFFCTILFAFYILTFDTSHGYNSPGLDFFLRNNFLEIVRNNFLVKSLVFIFAAFALFSLAVTPLKEPGYYWLYPFSIISLLPIGLIEQRYFIIPIALFMLFRKPLDRRLEYLQVTLYVPFTVYIFEGIAHYRFFL